MLDFDEDRASISDRKIASNIPPAIAGYKETRPYLKIVGLVPVAPVVILILVLWLSR